MIDQNNINLPKEDSELGVRGTNLELKGLPKYDRPEQKGDKVVTLNQQGFMKVQLDTFSRQFIEYSAQTKAPVLEIGAAYGLTSSLALKAGATVIANDIDPRHLAILYHNTPKEELDRLYLKLGSFPEGLDFPKDSLGAVLICMIAHFLDGQQIEDGLKKVHDWLVPGGKLFFVTLSPYHHLLREKFLPLYLERQAKGDDWPGLIDNMREYNPPEAEDIPNFLHVFDEQVMSRALLTESFEIETITRFDYDTNNSDGVGYLGFVAKCNL